MHMKKRMWGTLLTALVLLGLVAMYMAGEVALTASAKQKK